MTTEADQLAAQATVIQRLNEYHQIQQDKIDRLREDVERLRTALKPFADSYTKFVADHVAAFSHATPDEAVLLIETDEDPHYLSCRVGDFRNAADVLA